MRNRTITFELSRIRSAGALAQRCIPVAIALLVSCSMPGLAQTRDYSKGFQKFYTLGLPDVKNAKYVKLDMYSNADGMRRAGLHELSLKGNAWLLEENKEGASLFVVGECRLVEVYDRAWLAKEQKKKAKDKAGKESRSRSQRDEDDDGRIAGVWKEVNPEKDIQKILSYLKKQAEDPEDSRWSFRSGGYGQLFLTAIHFHRNGHTEEGNRIVEALFSLAADRRQVIFQALNTLGDARYHKAYDAFKKDGDWGAFGDELQRLTGLFATGWEMCPAIQRLTDKTRQRAGMATAPDISGEELTDEDRTLAMELANAPDNRQLMYLRHYSALWVLATAGKETAKDDEHVVNRIVKRGMKSVPLLMALIEDDFLTRVDLQSLKGDYYSPYSYSSDVMSEERIQRIYNSMRRPASRSEIAVYLLEPLLPRDEESRSITDGPVDPEAFHEECEAWYNTHKDMSSLDLARAYFKDGNRPQKDMAISFLMKKGNESDMTAIEEHFLAAERPEYASGMLHQYVNARAEKAKDFVDKYEAVLRKRAAEGSDESFDEGNFERMIERTIASFKELVSRQPASELLAEIVSGKKELHEATGLPQRLGREPRDKAMAMVLEAALKAEKPEVSAALTGYCAQVPYLALRYSQFNETSSEDEPEDDPYDIKTHAELWKKLLSDTREIEPEYAARKTTVAESAAWTIETLCLGEDADAARSTYALLGGRLVAIIHSRAEARLDGKAEDELPSLPDSDNIDSDARKKLAERIIKSGADKLDAVIAELGMDELLALAEMGRDNKELNTHLAPVANRINEVQWDFKSSGDEYAKLEGTTINRKTVEKMLALCKTATAEGKLVVCTVSRQPCLAGTTMVLRHILPESEDFQEWKTRIVDSGSKEWKARVDGHLSAPNMYTRTSWLIETPEPETALAPKEKQQESDEDNLLDDMEDELENEMSGRIAESQKDFWNKLEEFCKGEENVCVHASIAIWGTPIIDIPAETDPDVKEEKKEQEEGAST